MNLSRAVIGGKVLAAGVGPVTWGRIFGATDKGVCTVPPALFRALKRAGIEAVGADGRLSRDQLAKLLETNDTVQRIALRKMIADAGVYPA